MSDFIALTTILELTHFQLEGGSGQSLSHFKGALKRSLESGSMMLPDIHAFYIVWDGFEYLFSDLYLFQKGRSCHIMFTVLAAFVAYTSTALGFYLDYLDKIKESVCNHHHCVCLRMGGGRCSQMYQTHQGK